ncbi:hypothetical protein FHW67_002362 [Herbaspirillum sp. Sphag1AN]|uniref:hypothetical protein n=1 Tax=unclassified Herbaspirillum TaxID=2624150 RepID=UPI00160B8161|nr:MULTISPECIES: hypothetical protein [unclassified Herbaspirillum]MBB3213073.1 hypothetical protein [Herbaspirillum sp. Sphag1AN]MBB3246270.1 hypothetical protein [Herbaspirillum sp. Sphag64]
MHKLTDPLSAEIQQPVTVLHCNAINTSINGTEYLLESRVLQLDAATHRSEYRVLRGQVIIKDWAEGNVGQYFQT